jgi:hypothetical protein
MIDDMILFIGGPAHNMTAPSRVPRGTKFVMAIGRISDATYDPQLAVIPTATLIRMPQSTGAEVAGHIGEGKYPIKGRDYSDPLHDVFWHWEEANRA